MHRRYELPPEDSFLDHAWQGSVLCMYAVMVLCESLIEAIDALADGICCVAARLWRGLRRGSRRLHSRRP
jgi:hypothetical protein